MATANKLNDTQCVILGAATEREGGRVLPVPTTVKAKGAALSRVLEALLQRGLIEEQRAARGDEEHRRDPEGRRLTLAITSAGLAALGIDDDGQAPETLKAPMSRSKGKTEVRSPVLREGTKGAAIKNLLDRKNGATMAELTDASGWQAHSVRGFVSGTLKKKFGIAVVSQKSEGDGERRYRIAS